MSHDMTNPPCADHFIVCLHFWEILFLNTEKSNDVSATLNNSEQDFTTT